MLFDFAYGNDEYLVVSIDDVSECPIMFECEEIKARELFDDAKILTWYGVSLTPLLFQNPGERRLSSQLILETSTLLLHKIH